MNKLWIIVREVYRKNVKSGSFLMMVFGPILLMGVIGMIGYFIGQSKVENSVGDIGLVNASQEVQEILIAADLGNHYYPYTTSQEAQADLANDVIDGYFDFTVNQPPFEVTYYRKNTSQDIDPVLVTQVLDSYQKSVALQEAGVDPQVIAEIQSSSLHAETVNLSFDSEGNQTSQDADSTGRMIRTGVAYVVSFVVYLFIMTYVGIISQEIATEKGSRIMEIILSSVSANQHFFGKLIGISLVILTQLAIYLGLFIIGRIGFNAFDINEMFNLPFSLTEVFNQAKSDLLMGVLFGFLGILIYSSLAAFLGSLVSKTEDVQKMISPLVLLGVAGFYIGMYALSSTNNAIVRIGSHVPFFTPFVMPFRLAAGTVQTNEIYLAIVLSLAFVVISLGISSVFYKSNILVTSDKGLIKTFKRSYELWKSEKQG